MDDGSTPCDCDQSSSLFLVREIKGTVHWSSADLFEPVSNKLLHNFWDDIVVSVIPHYSTNHWARDVTLDVRNSREINWRGGGEGNHPRKRKEDSKKLHRAIDVGGVHQSENFWYEWAVWSRWNFDVNKEYDVCEEWSAACVKYIESWPAIALRGAESTNNELAQIYSANSPCLSWLVDRNFETILQTWGKNWSLHHLLSSSLSLKGASPSFLVL